LFDEAVDALQICLGQLKEGCPANPLVHYYLAYSLDQLGRSDQATKHLKLGAEASPDFCFPFQIEAARILSHALERNPHDPRAPYYLGNLLYDNQPLKAISAWETAINLDNQFAPAHRNLGLARAQTKKDIPGAILELEKAIALNPEDPRFYYELDVLYESGGAAIAKRLAMLDQKPAAVAKRDDAVTRRATLLIASGQAEEALRLLRDRHFHNWEGSGSLHDVYVDACLQAGSHRLKDGKATEALALFNAALEYPANQEVGKGKREGRVAQIYYHIGQAQKALGKQQDATAAFQRAAKAGENNFSEGQFCKALALQTLQEADEAQRLFTGLEKHGQQELERESESVDYFAKFGEKRAERLRLAEAHFLAGLGALGLGKQQDAHDHFRQALELHPAHLGALTWQAGPR
jgi:tetratricopeptide (TPR) repeat protein